MMMMMSRAGLRVRIEAEWDRVDAAGSVTGTRRAVDCEAEPVSPANGSGLQDFFRALTGGESCADRCWERCWENF